MKKLYASLAAVSIAAAAMAAPALPLQQNAQQYSVKEGLLLKGQRTVGKQVKHSEPGSVRFAAPAPESQAIINQQPAGKSTLYSRSSIGYLVFWGMLFATEDSGYAVTIVNGDDGKTYINNPFSTIDTGAWLECTVEGNEVTIPGPQAVYTEDGEVLYAVGLEYTELYDEEFEEYYGTYVTGEDLNYKLVIEGDRIKAADELALLGLVLYDADAQDYEWSGYGDYNIDMLAFTGENLQPAAGLETEQWACLSEEGGHFVSVGFANGECWLKGIFDALPEAWAKGTLDGTTVTFENGQYLGIDGTSHFNYLSGGGMVPYYDENWEEWTEILGDCGPAIFTYDEAAKTLSSDMYVVRVSDMESWNFLGYLTQPTIERQTRNPLAVPATPYDVYYMDYDEDYGFAGIQFNLPNFDVEGNLLDGNRMYYEILIDGEPFTFEPDEYIYLSAPMTQIPYYFTEDYDFYINGVQREVYFYFEGLDTIGVRSYYVDESNQVFASEIGWDEYYSSVKAVEGKTLSTSTFDLMGLPVANGTQGMVIERRQLDNGRVVFTKKVNK